MNSRFNRSTWHYLLRVLKSIALYRSVPPYNLNWFISFSFLDEFLGSDPICVVDVGARGGSCDELTPLRRYVDFIGFDADAKECERLNRQANADYQRFRVHPLYVGKAVGPQSFHLYENPAHSSQLLPDAEFQRSFQESLRIAETVSVDGTTLDSFIGENDIDVDFLKIDTQGTEYECLTQASRAIGNAMMIECEVEFVSMYQGQRLFHDVCALLYRNNYQLLYLNRVFGKRSGFDGLARGQLVFGDMLFGLKLAAVADLRWEKQLKYCALLINYGHLDFAYEILQGNQELRTRSPELCAFFEKRRRRKTSLLLLLTTGIWAQIEKILFLCYFLRTTNRLTNDSDRSVPMR